MNKCCIGGVTLGLGATVILLLLCYFFLQTGADISEEVSGNGNRISNHEEKEISIFHFENLSNQMDDLEGRVGLHNSVKYGLIVTILIVMLFVSLFKCKNVKKNMKKKQRNTDMLEMVECHHDSLAAQGMLKQPQTRKKKEEEQERREEEDKQKKEEKKKRVEEEKKKKKPEFKKTDKKMMKKKWVQIDVSISDDDDES